jgi:hypothetical protein
VKPPVPASDPDKKYRVIRDATVREGPDKKDRAMGEFQKGQVIEVVEEMTNAEGLDVVKTTTLPANSESTIYSVRNLDGGWVKIKTSKDKVQLQEIST